MYYHERIGKMHPADVHLGRANEVRARRKQVKAETLAKRLLENRGLLACREQALTNQLIEI